MNKATLLNQQGADILKSRKYSESIDYFLQSLEEDPELVYAHYNLGLAYQYLNDFEKSLHTTILFSS